MAIMVDYDYESTPEKLIIEIDCVPTETIGELDDVGKAVWAILRHAHIEWPIERLKEQLDHALALVTYD